MIQALPSSVDELLNPAHGISWGAILFVAGGSWFMLRASEKKIAKLETDYENLKERVDRHEAWSEEKSRSMAERDNEQGERISKLEGIDTSLQVTIQALNTAVKEVDKLREKVDDITTSVSKLALVAFGNKGGSTPSPG